MRRNQQRAMSTRCFHRAYLRPTTKSASQESSLTAESTRDSVARNWSCVMSTVASVADGLRWLPRVPMPPPLLSPPPLGPSRVVSVPGFRGGGQKAIRDTNIRARLRTNIRVLTIASSRFYVFTQKGRTTQSRFSSGQNNVRGRPNVQKANQSGQLTQTLCKRSTSLPRHTHWTPST